MGGYTEKVNFITEFDGDKISMDLERLTRADMLTLSPYMKSGADGSAVMVFEDALKMMEAAIPIFKKRITNFSGCLDANGVQLTIDMVAESSYHSGMFDSVLSKLLEISMLSKQTAKKSGVMSDEPSTSNEGTAQGNV